MSRSILPSSLEVIPRRKFRLDRHSEYYTEDRINMKQVQLLTFKELYLKYNQIIILDISNVYGGDLANLRRYLRTNEEFDSELVVGKLSVNRRIIKEMITDLVKQEHATHHQKDCEIKFLNRLNSRMTGQIALLFTNETDINKIKEIVRSKTLHRRAAKAGDIATEDIWILPGDSGIDPSDTRFFAPSNIATKISKGRIEILSTKLLVPKGQPVSVLFYNLLSLLKLKPIVYQATVLYIFDKESFAEMTPEILERDIEEAVNNLSALSPLK